jgi:hypothetical protein
VEEEQRTLSSEGPPPTNQDLDFVLGQAEMVTFNNTKKREEDVVDLSGHRLQDEYYFEGSSKQLTALH